MSAGKMRLLPKKRLEIYVEAPLLRRLLSALDELDVPGYSLMDIVGGRGGGIAWTETDEIGNVSRMLCVISLVEPDRLDGIVTHIAGILADRIGVTAISDVEVLVGGSAFG